MPRGEEERAGDVPASFEVEPSLLPETHRLAPRFRRPEWNRAYLEHLERRLRRNPRDLRSHVRRILLLHRRGRLEECFEAMVALFRQLGPSGLELRLNLLTQVGPELRPEQRRFLRDHLESGLLGTPVPEGVMEEPPCIVVEAGLGEGLSGVDPLAQARALLRQRPPEEAAAQSLLEGALHQDPGREDICRELLALYRHRRARADFRRTYAALMGRRLALPELWRETERALG